MVTLVNGSGNSACFCGHLELLGEFHCSFANVWAVHEEKGLGRDDGVRTASLADQGFRGVEELHAGDDPAALDHEVDAAPGHGFVQGSLAEHGLIEKAADLQDAVTDHLGFKSCRGPSPEQAVGGVFRCSLAVVCRNLPLDDAEKEELV